MDSGGLAARGGLSSVRAYGLAAVVRGGVVLARQRSPETARDYLGLDPRRCGGPAAGPRSDRAPFRTLEGCLSAPTAPFDAGSSMRAPRHDGAEPASKTRR